jgi:glucosamine kinase
VQPENGGMNDVNDNGQASRPGLGLDAGGTQTRWALADAGGALLAQGTAAAISGLQLDSAEGRAAMAGTLQGIADAVGPVCAVVAGVTGFDATQQPQMCAMLAAALRLDPRSAHAVRALNDIELACHAAFAPGAGYVVYAGTGTVAAFVDEQGQLHRAGGRGALIDDAGGGHWIAREALRRIWRAEDHAPGAWQQSLLARKVFAHIGGSDWALSRQWAYNASRGELGLLALAVADAAAEHDADALALLHDAGAELARLALALLQRLGPRPLALAGRVFLLHPAIEASLRSALPAGTQVTHCNEVPHIAAARLAARPVLHTGSSR